MMQTTTLTPAQHETLIAIEQFIAENGMPPTIRELIGIHKLKSPAPVQARINGLVDAEAISIVPKKARTIRVLIPSAEWRIKSTQGGAR